MAINPIKYLISNIVYYEDMFTRKELHSNNISNERDYVSNLTSNLRHIYRKWGIPNYVYSKVLPDNTERRLGCDGLIMVKIDSILKIALFEAKWPRLLLDPKYQWDKIDKNGISHFSNQLNKQSIWSKYFYIFELFIMEHDFTLQPLNFDDWGSTCISHKKAYLFDRMYRKSNIKWKNVDLLNLMNMNNTTFINNKNNLFFMLSNLISCRRGKKYTVNGDPRLVLKNDKADENIRQLSLPLRLDNMESEIPEFMETTGLEHFVYFEVNSENLNKFKLS